MDIPIIDQAKIQAQVLVPLVKTLQAELGEERANTIVRKALADLYRKFGEEWWQGQRGRDLGETMASAFDRFAAGDALDHEVLRKTPNGFDVNVTGCRAHRRSCRELATATFDTPSRRERAGLKRSDLRCGC